MVSNGGSSELETYPVTSYLARRPKETVRVYTRGLQMFADHVKVPLNELHEYIKSPKRKLVEDILSFGGSEKILSYNQNTQRLYVSAIMAYLSYNGIVIPKGQRLQAVPKPGDTFKDRAITIDQLRKIYEYLPPIGRATILLLFSTGMRIGEVISIRENDIEGRIIHLSGKYCKGGKGRDVVMSTECQVFLKDIWLPQKAKYLDIASRKTPCGIDKNGNPHLCRNGKSSTDDRVIPVNKQTLYSILMLGFKKAGCDAQKDGKNLFHPHSLRKSFKTIAGSIHPELSEILLGHAGYLNGSYWRGDILEEYKKIEPFLTMGSTEATTSRLDALQKENAVLQERLQQVEKRQNLQQSIEVEDLSPEEIQKALLVLKALQKAKS